MRNVLPHLQEPAFEAGEGSRIGAGLAAMINALRQRLDLDLERFHRMPRQRLGQRTTNLGEIGAQTVDRVFEFGRRPQRLDPERDLAQLLFETAEIDRLDWRVFRSRMFFTGRGNFRR